MTLTDAPAVAPLDERREAKLTTIRALLAKAESTEFADEARFLTAKAQELMSRYALSEALLAERGEGRDEIVTVVVGVERPYQSPKGLILNVVADANRCRVVESTTSRGLTFHLTGYSSDAERAQMLFTSLLIQAARELFAAIAPTWVNLRSFRHAFLIGFATEIGDRLAAVSKAAEEDCLRETGTDLLPVLADRCDAVAREVERRWGRLRTSRVTYQANGGYSKGRKAGKRADLGSRGLLSRRALARR